MFIPTRIQFDEAINIPNIRIKIPDPELKLGKVELVQGVIPGPYGMQGGFAIVYKFRTQSGKLRALRVFTRPMDPDIASRYEKIGRYFKTHLGAITAEFIYHEAALLVKNDIGSQARFPLINMEWIEGVELLDRVDELCQNRDKLGLALLLDRWVELLKKLRKVHVAHGDLSGGDVIVQPDGSLMLVDYDGVYIPDLEGRMPIVLGQRDFQHPQFSKRVFNEYMDSFSGLAIFTALLALRALPELWDSHARYAEGGELISERILFTHSDYENPEGSKLLVALAAIDDPELKIALFELKQSCYLPIEHVRFPEHLFESHITADKISFLKATPPKILPYTKSYDLPKFSRPLNVFLCHSSNDKLGVRKLYGMLLVDGIDPWLDEEKLLPGQDWELEIKKAERNSDVIIVCLSKESVKKTGYVQKELKFALEIAQEKPEGQIFVIPLKLEECDIPEALRRLQWVNFFDDRTHDRLIDSLRLRAAEIGIILR